ncbi:MAG: SET domain-containing protein-lysine N-methyltransferase, partial [Leptospiraceae bacterium]|nr:SET domain-containing protein-lysine N-methyltransferase [Leptospiraceae bacterium]
TEEEGERLEEKGVDCSHMLDITGLEVKGYAYIHPDKKMLLGYINHSPATVDRKRVSGKKAFNVEFLEKKTSPYIQIQAVKRIEAGDEIYLNYGSYFTRLYVSTEKAKNFYRN